MRQSVASAAGEHGRQQHPLAAFSAVTPGADLGDRARHLVAENDRRRLERRACRGRCSAGRCGRRRTPRPGRAPRPPRARESARRRGGAVVGGVEARRPSRGLSWCRRRGIFCSSSWQSLHSSRRSSAGRRFEPHLEAEAPVERRGLVRRSRRRPGIGAAIPPAPARPPGRRPDRTPGVRVPSGGHARGGRLARRCWPSTRGADGRGELGEAARAARSPPAPAVRGARATMVGKRMMPPTSVHSGSSRTRFISCTDRRHQRHDRAVQDLGRRPPHGQHG